MDNNVIVSGTDTLSDPKVWLDYLATIFRTLGDLLKRLDGRAKSQLNVDPSVAQHCLSECLLFVRKVVWPVVARALSHYANQSRTMEHACRLVRFIVRCFSIHLCDLLPEIAERVSFFVWMV